MFTLLLMYYISSMKLNYTKVRYGLRVHQSEAVQPTARSGLYSSEFVEATSIILPTEYDLETPYQAKIDPIRRTRRKFRYTRTPEVGSAPTTLYNKNSRNSRRQDRIFADLDQHTLVVLDNQKAYYNTKTNELVVEY